VGQVAEARGKVAEARGKVAEILRDGLTAIARNRSDADETTASPRNDRSLEITESRTLGIGMHARTVSRVHHVSS